MYIRRFSVVAALALVASLFSIATEASQCPQFFPGGAAPVITNQKINVRTHEICYTDYSLLTSGVTRTALWSAEHLTKTKVIEGAALVRKDTFHPDENVPAEDRAELSDYMHSGFDRGHMSPNKDFPTRESENECFSLANMVPQVPAHNQGLWADIEGAVRNLARADNELYIVTGPAFISNGQPLQSLKGRVMVPTNIWKAVYDPSKGTAGVYWTVNEVTNDYDTISIDELTKRIGIDVMPGLPAAVKAHAMQLPAPIKNPHHSSSSYGPRQTGEQKMAIALVRHLLR